VGERTGSFLCSLAYSYAVHLRRKIVLGHILLTVLGLLLVILGFWGGHVWPKPYASLVAWCAPVGLVVTLIGIVLLFIPNFFT
jgi:hypothetical protein